MHHVHVHGWLVVDGSEQYVYMYMYMCAAVSDSTMVLMCTCTIPVSSPQLGGEDDAVDLVSSALCIYSKPVHVLLQITKLELAWSSGWMYIVYACLALHVPCLYYRRFEPGRLGCLGSSVGRALD